MEQDTAPTAPGAARSLASIVLVACGLYTVLDIVAQLLPPHYSPIRQAESDLAVGPYGWLMSVNFVVRGVLAAAGARAIALSFPRRSRPRFGIGLLWVFAAGSALLAVFPTDILDDRRLDPHPVATVHGEVHLAAATLAFVAVAMGALLISFALARASALAGARPAAITLAALGALALLALPTVGRLHAGGLDERLFLVLCFVWLGTLMWRLRGTASSLGGPTKAVMRASPEGVPPSAGPRSSPGKGR